MRSMGDPDYQYKPHSAERRAKASKRMRQVWKRKHTQEDIDARDGVIDSILQLVLLYDDKPKIVAAEFGISPGLIYHWLREAGINLKEFRKL